MNGLLVKETNEELIRKLKTRIAAKEISEQELVNLTDFLRCSQCGREITEREVKKISRKEILKKAEVWKKDYELAAQDKERNQEAEEWDDLESDDKD